LLERAENAPYSVMSPNISISTDSCSESYVLVIGPVKLSLVNVSVVLPQSIVIEPSISTIGNVIDEVFSYLKIIPSSCVNVAVGV